MEIVFGYTNDDYCTIFFDDKKADKISQKLQDAYKEELPRWREDISYDSKLKAIIQIKWNDDAYIRDYIKKELYYKDTTLQLYHIHPQDRQASFFKKVVRWCYL